MTMTETTAIEGDDSALLAIIREQRIRGRDYLDIERMFGIPAPRAEAIMRTYYANKSAGIDPNEMRMLQLDRLEGMIDTLFSMTAMGNIKASEGLTKILETINGLLGLNIEATKTEIRIITEDQGQIIYEMVLHVMRKVLNELVTPLVTNQKQLAQIEDQWDTIVLEGFKEKSAEIIEQNAAEIEA